MAGTFFERMRSPRAWLAIIWFFEKGIAINGWKLHELSGIAQSSAFNLLKKFATLMRELLPADGETVSSELFSSLFAKRSRETPARQHPRTEQSEFPTAQACSAVSNHSDRGLGSVPDDPLSASRQATTVDEPEIEDGAQRRTYSFLSDEPVHFDMLCQQTNLPAGHLGAALTMLELADLIEPLIGNYYVRKLKKRSRASIQSGMAESFNEQTSARVSGIIDFILATWKGISRKYLQNYIGMYRFLAGNSQLRPSLLDICLQARPVAYKHIIVYVTPPMVTI